MYFKIIVIFRAFGSYLDGGLIANNPTLDAMTEIHEHCLALEAVGREHEKSPLSVVVSLGTGSIPVLPIKEIDVYRPTNIFDGIKIYSGMTTLGTLLVDQVRPTLKSNKEKYFFDYLQATLSDGRVIDRARAWCSMIGVPYFRFSPQLSEEIAMNEMSDEKLCNMLWETKVFMYNNQSTIKQIADLLNRN